MEKWIFLLLVFSTLFMTGVIWFVQVVHYPLFARVGEEAFVRYEGLHTVRTGWVVAPVMLAELGATLLWAWQAPGSIPRWSLMALILLTLAIWAATFLIQVPLHGRLMGGHDPGLIRRLVGTNWIRTLAWTLKSGVLAWLLLRVGETG